MKALIKKCIEKGKIIVMPNGYIQKYSYLKTYYKKRKFNIEAFRKYNNYINLTFIGTIGASTLGLIGSCVLQTFTLVGMAQKLKV